MIRLLHGDCIELMRGMPDDSVDAIVCDPPYGLGFLGKRWDAPGLEWAHEWAEGCRRVLKPGGHLVAFGGTRTVHRLAVAIEDGGLEIRDLVTWLYWSGFPKSLDVSKAIDRAAGAEREVIGIDHEWIRRTGRGTSPDGIGLTQATFGSAAGPNAGKITAPATPEAEQWAGWGTALKPAQEPAVLARKPLIGTVAANVLEWGTGALNIDGCRFAVGDDAWPGPQDGPGGWGGKAGFTGSLSGGTGLEKDGDARPVDGRWPANLYACPKASRSEREAGCEGLKRKQVGSIGGADRDGPLDDVSARFCKVDANIHPTVKPVRLMRWLCRLVTPPGGVVLDTFMGSGTTGVACCAEGFHFIGCEREPEYMRIAAARIQHHATERIEVDDQFRPPPPVQSTLFGGTE